MAGQSHAADAGCDRRMVQLTEIWCLTESEVCKMLEVRGCIDGLFSGL